MADVQIAVIDQQNTQVTAAVPGIQGPQGQTGDVAVAQDGTAALPGIRFENDTNTGIYRPGADQLALSTGGTGRLFISDDGKIGIGTSTPSSYAIQADDLVIAPSTSSAGISLVASTANFIYFSDLDAEGRGVISYGHGDDFLRFSTAASQRLIITSNGDVNIVGTGTPGVTQSVSFNGSAPVDSLVVNSSGNVSAAGTMTAGSFIPTSSTVPTNGVYLPAANSVALSTNGTGRLFISSIGVYTNQNYFTDATSGYFFGGSASFNNGIYGVGTNNCAIAVNGSERLRISSAGLVGIGTSLPGERLTVAGNVSLSAAQPYISLIDSVWGSGSTFRSGVNTLGTALGDYQLFNVPTGKGFAFAQNNATNSLVIDTSGRVGIGTTSPGSPLDVQASGNGGASFNDGIRIYAANRSQYANFGYNGLNATDNLAFFIADTEAARIDSSRRLLVGTSSSVDVGGASAVAQFTSTASAPHTLSLVRNNTPILALANSGSVSSGSGLGALLFCGNDGTDLNTLGAQIVAEVDGTPGANDMPGRLVFATTADGASVPTERMRINKSGAQQSFSENDVCRAATAQGAGTSFGFYYGYHSATTTQNGTLAYLVLTNGDVKNTNNSYGAISDIKLKENIVDANSQWDDIKAVQVRNYNFKEGQTHTQIGLVAQEVELVSPGLVSESPDRDEDGNDLGTVTKSVNYSVLYMKAVKALQEAMERIETLEQRLSDAGIN